MPYCIFLAAPGMDQLKGLYENARYSSRNLGSVGTGTVSFEKLLSRFVFQCKHFSFQNSLIDPVRSASVLGELVP